MECSDEDYWSILLVEDDEDDYLLIRGILDQIKHNAYRLKWFKRDILTAQIACDQPFDVALIDLRLGGQSGLEIIKKIKATCSSLPVILISGWDVSDLKPQALQAGANAILSKNELTGQTLYTHLCEVMDHHR